MMNVLARVIAPVYITLSLLCGEQKTESRPVKYWEIIADNLSEAGLVRITNNATGHVFYSRTHDHTSMAVASGALVSTHFDVPATEERGPSQLVVVANGIPSAPVAVTVE